jgi:hypothetical protein
MTEASFGVCSQRANQESAKALIRIVDNVNSAASTDF